ncbi:type II toxin-antitoxin system VapC family toxin [Falsiroseomonas stagni]|uniref:Ribonuclease VapC n=1 Tax=Falsiroseomonas stagni DSM 19981 TaxID=1123062 RepID=A0A1I4EM17_9PROT|nr:type II toxin-antitoxin system VapC family toxin [Falsiroseomonas stagni]SFL06792.1 Uncharacterized protein, contains PIN domain [Falsiroseomonas stagni DSM 19981]
MIVDSSAIVAILRGEPEAADFSRAIVLSGKAAMTAATWVEAAMVVEGRAEGAADARFDDLIRDLGITIEPVTMTLARGARQAFRRYGRGRHPARLNFGDCFSYALAQERGEPLLFKGDDFAQTDVKRAI